MSDSQHSMYDNEHAEWLFAEVMSPTAWRHPLEQKRLDACHHLARLVEQLGMVRELNRRAEERCAEAFMEARGLKEQLESERGLADVFRRVLRTSHSLTGLTLTIGKDGPNETELTDAEFDLVWDALDAIDGENYSVSIPAKERL